MAEPDELSFVEFWKAMAIAGAIALVLLIVFIWSGFYNVSAHRGHFDGTTWLLDQVRKQSIRAQSASVSQPPSNLHSDDMVILGAAHYELSCAACHGAPGRPAAAITGAMLPEPPPLDNVAGRWSREELFWIVHNGQKYTGMPAWIAFRREDEVWPIVAFLERLADLQPQQYRELTGAGETEPGVSLGQQESDIISVCVRCHGAPGARTRSGLVPWLSGQNEAYLRRSLEEYRDGTRPSGYMQLIASGLNDATIAQLAAAYAAAPSPSATTSETDAEMVSQGGETFSAGISERDVPPCVTCHSRGNSQFPALAGQSADFIATQLRVFREGTRSGTGYGAIMTRVARSMTDADIAAVSQYLSSLPSGIFSSSSGNAPQ